MKTVNKYGLEYAGPRRARRGTLKHWLIDLILGAVAMALLWWLFSLVHRAATVGDVMPLGAQAGKPMLRTAGFGVPEWVAFGVVGTLVMGILGRLAWGAMQDAFQIREPQMADGDGWGDKTVPGEVVDPLKVGGNTIPPSEEMPAGLTRRDAALIVHACGCEVGLLRNLVRSAQKPLSEDDQAETLAVAERRLGQLRVTLWELRARFSASQGLPVSESLTEEASGKA